MLRHFMFLDVQGRYASNQREYFYALFTRILLASPSNDFRNVRQQTSFFSSYSRSKKKFAEVKIEAIFMEGCYTRLIKLIIRFILCVGPNFLNPLGFCSAICMVWPHHKFDVMKAVLWTDMEPLKDLPYYRNRQRQNENSS